MSEKVHKALRKQQYAQMAAEMCCQAEDERKAKYLTVRLMPLIPFIAMVFATPQGSLYLPEMLRNPLYVSIGCCLMYLILWAIDVFVLQKKEWEVGPWKWLGLLAPVGCLYLWFRARNTDKEYAFAFVWLFMKVLSLFIVGPGIFA